MPHTLVKISQDFDSGSLDVDHCRIGNGPDGQPRIHLAPRRTWRNQHWWIFFRMAGIRGIRPAFEVPIAGSFAPVTEHLRYVFSHDRASWTAFDHAEISGGLYRFRHEAPFAKDTVYIAYGTPYPMERLRAKVRAWSESPHVAATASADPGLEIGSTPGTDRGGYRDDGGRQVLSQPVYGFQITGNPECPSKRTVVVLGGNHPGETLSGIIIEGMVAMLLENSPIAGSLRQQFRFLFYPNINPEGRAAGYFRSSPEMPELDHNRGWSGTSPLATIRRVKQAVEADIAVPAGRPVIEYFFDVHSGWNPRMRADPGPQNAHWHVLNPGGDESAFHKAFVRRQAGAWAKCRIPKDPGSAVSWALSPAIHAEHVVTPEPSFGMEAGFYHRVGRNYMLALGEMRTLAQK